MKKLIKKWIKEWLSLYDIIDLQIGANCGCCGEWIPETIVEKDYAWDLCNKCESVGDILPHILPDRPWPKPPKRESVL